MRLAAEEEAEEGTGLFFEVCFTVFVLVCGFRRAFRSNLLFCLQKRYKIRESSKTI